MVVGDIISFTYKGSRKVKGEITKFVSNGLVVKLNTDYIGKNEEWHVGELKLFNKKEMMQCNRFVFVIFADDHKKLSLHSLPIAYYDFIDTEDVDLYTFSKYIDENQPDFHLGISWRHRYAMINHGRINICRRPGDLISHKWPNEVTEISGQDSNPCSEISLIEYPTARSQAMIIDLEHSRNKEIRQRILRDKKLSTILK